MIYIERLGSKDFTAANALVVKGDIAATIVRNLRQIIGHCSAAKLCLNLHYLCVVYSFTDLSFVSLKITPSLDNVFAVCVFYSSTLTFMACNYH